MTKRKGLSQRQYAAHAGVSLGLVCKMRRQGRLVLHDDGSVNVAATDEMRAQTEGPNSKGQQDEPPEPSFEEAAHGDGAEAVGDGDSYSEARRVGQIIKVRREKLSLDTERGALVDADRARKLAFEMFRLERDAWLNWPARVAAVMASELGIDASEMERVLDSHVREHLSDIAEPKINI